MTGYVTGSTIKMLREKKKYTQKQLADILKVSDKTVSKWETGRGLPDITMLEPISSALGVSVTELLSGEQMNNGNKSANMMKSVFYVCPVCGNVIHSIGEGAFSCCGIKLPPLEAEDAEGHELKAERIENDYYITVDHPMSREHFISFFAYVTGSRVQLVKQYPEQNAEARVPVSGHGIIYAFCNKHGLFAKRI